MAKYKYRLLKINYDFYENPIVSIGYFNSKKSLLSSKKSLMSKYERCLAQQKTYNKWSMVK